MSAIGSNTHILIVDDSSIARKLMINHLNELGITSVVEAIDGSDGLAKLLATRTQSKGFDMIITDLRMPGMSGTEFLQAVCAEDDFKKIPKLIASVETDRGTVLDAVLTGADGYILKPISTDVLKAKMQQAIARRKAG